ncbi:hypothetical protein [Treponema sp.]|uniref:hypothetical protein n=1 Tax=Treponema sp. TaxID=166 RepID=UPI00388D45E2
MKKLFILSALICAGVLFSATAKEKADYKYEFQEAAVSYRNVLIYKVLDQKDAYIVMYAKGHREVGNVTIPKKWYSSAARTDSKLTFRSCPKTMQPYMTVISRDGSFERVIMTMPTSRNNPVWGVADSSVKVDDADKETLEIAY